jgi:hypothetical protein
MAAAPMDVSFKVATVWTPRHTELAVVGALGTGLLIGLPTDVVPNPVFGRAIAVTWWSYPSLAVIAVLSGLLPGGDDDAGAAGADHHDLVVLRAGDALLHGTASARLSGQSDTPCCDDATPVRHGCGFTKTPAAGGRERQQQVPGQLGAAQVAQLLEHATQRGRRPAVRSAAASERDARVVRVDQPGTPATQPHAQASQPGAVYRLCGRRQCIERHSGELPVGGRLWVVGIRDPIRASGCQTRQRQSSTAVSDVASRQRQMSAVPAIAMRPVSHMSRGTGRSAARRGGAIPEGATSGHVVDDQRRAAASSAAGQLVPASAGGLGSRARCRWSRSSLRPSPRGRPPGTPRAAPGLVGSSAREVGAPPSSNRLRPDRAGSGAFTAGPADGVRSLRKALPVGVGVGRGRQAGVRLVAGAPLVPTGPRHVRSTT